MALTTSIVYGDITISNDAVSMLVSRVALDCYGIVELAARRLSDSLLELFNKPSPNKGVKIVTENNKVYVDVYVILKEGVNREAVEESLHSSIEYHVEQLTGMLVKSVKIHIVGIKL